MKNIVLVLAVCVALTACAKNEKSPDTAAQLQNAAPKPSESLLTTKDMNDCEQQLGIVQPKTAADVYVMSQDSIEKVKDCAFGLEKQRMPLLADLIDKYSFTLQQGNKECARDIGTHYASSCMKNSLDGAEEWYNLAVSQRILNAMPNQSQVQVPKAAH